MFGSVGMIFGSLNVLVEFEDFFLLVDVCEIYFFSYIIFLYEFIFGGCIEVEIVLYVDGDVEFVFNF